MVDTLWTNQIPTSTNNADGTPGIATGTTIQVLNNRICVGIQFRCTDTKGGTYTAELWRCTGADALTPSGVLLASKSFAATEVTAGLYNNLMFDTTVNLTPGVLYRCDVHNSQGRYVASNGFFASAGLTVGDIVAYQSGTDPNPPGLGVMRQGVFNISATAGTYPAIPSGASASYHVGPVLATNIPSEVTLTPLQVAFSVLPVSPTPGAVTVELSPLQVAFAVQPVVAVGTTAARENPTIYVAPERVLHRLAGDRPTYVFGDRLTTRPS